MFDPTAAVEQRGAHRHQRTGTTPRSPTASAEGELIVTSVDREGLEDGVTARRETDGQMIELTGIERDFTVGDETVHALEPGRA